MPKSNVREAAVVNNLDVYGMENIVEVIKFLTGSAHFEPVVIDTRKEFYAQQTQFDLDFSDVRGQESVKRALEVAAAGGHNSYHDRSSRQWKVDDGQATSFHTSTALIVRKP